MRFRHLYSAVAVRFNLSIVFVIALRKCKGCVHYYISIRFYSSAPTEGQCVVIIL